MSTIAGGGQWSGRQYGDGDRYEGVGAVVWVVVACAAFLAALFLACGCTAVSVTSRDLGTYRRISIFDQRETAGLDMQASGTRLSLGSLSEDGSNSNALALVASVIRALQSGALSLPAAVQQVVTGTSVVPAGTNTVSAETPVVPATTDAPAAPIVGTHGTPQVVDNGQGDRWLQYPDGYWTGVDGEISEFIWNIDKPSRVGIAAVLVAAGGRNFGNAQITAIRCVPLSTFSPGGVECVDKADWTVTLAGGFTIDFSWSHSADAMPRAVVSDGTVSAEFPCNGHPCGGADDWCAGGRGYDFVTVNGRREATGIRMVHPDLRRR